MQGDAIQPARFAPFHRWDRSFFLAATLAIWAVLVTGFGIDIIKRGGLLGYAWIVHAHALVYTGWVALLAVQVALVRTRHVALHRSLGRVAVVLIPAMAILGPATPILLRSAMPNPSWSDLTFMGTQFTNVISACTLLTAGVLTVRNPATHKRLMLMGTISLTEPGFGRFLYGILYGWLGEGYLPYYVETYSGTLLLMLVVGGYDLATRRRVHPAWAIAAAWILANECLGTWLYYQPFWQHWMAALTGH